MKKSFFALLFALAIAPFGANLAAKTFDFEALYGYGWLKNPSGSEQHIQADAVFYTQNLTHELVFVTSFGGEIRDNGVARKSDAVGFEGEYRLGMRLDNDETMSKLGMLSGTVYTGFGYQTTKPKTGKGISQLYIPFGIWGEDDSGLSSLKVRYGANMRVTFYANDKISLDPNGALKQDWQSKSTFGVKIYLGLGYNIGNVLDLVAQGFFAYSLPTKGAKNYGIEAGLKF